MSTTLHLPAHSWASAHRALVIVLSLALAVAIAVTVAMVVSRATGTQTLPSLDSVTVPDGCYHSVPGTAC